MNKKRILLVDDDQHIIKLTSHYLEKADFEVLTAQTGQVGLELARQEQPDLIVLDINLPQMDGLEVCQILRQESDVPIIMLSARSEEEDRLMGLEIGADDYLTKPFFPRELVMRVQVLFRRLERSATPEPILRIGDLEVDFSGHTLRRDKQNIGLTPTEFAIFAILAQHIGQAVSREQLMESLYGVVIESYSRSIDAHIKNLRQKLEDNPTQPRYVHTVYGVGYKLAEAAPAY